VRICWPSTSPRPSKPQKRILKMTSLEEIQKAFEPLFPGQMGIRFLEATPDRVKASLDVRQGLCTVGGILHGGAHMTLADTLGAVGTFLNLPIGKRTTTVDSNTKFIGFAPSGSTLIAESLPLHRGRTMMVWQTTISTTEGKLCSVVTQSQLVLE
jgi:1,4-dihydroxy-2-naphthoyl-CoA hydrolase